jgi:ribA/ribD-fused uncharacterized protein
MNDEYEFFWDGIYSNWHPSEFTLDGMTFNCVEQYMMYKKAEVAGDTESMQAVMETPMPNEQKRIGRNIKNYDDGAWSAVRYEIVKDGVRAKFTQNVDLREGMLASGNKHIVEASPYDAVWGIAMGEDDPDRFDESKWRGANLLGKCCMDVRDELRESLEVAAGH